MFFRNILRLFFSETCVFTLIFSVLTFFFCFSSFSFQTFIYLAFIYPINHQIQIFINLLDFEFYFFWFPCLEHKRNLFRINTWKWRNWWLYNFLYSNTIKPPKPHHVSLVGRQWEFVGMLFNTWTCECVLTSQYWFKDTKWFAIFDFFIVFAMILVHTP